MAQVHELAAVSRTKDGKPVILLRGYKNSPKAGAFTPAKIRQLAQYLLLLADEAEEEV